MRLFAALLAGLLAPCPALRGGVSRSRAASQLRGGAAVSNSTDAVEAFLADKFQGVAAVFGANALRRASLEQFVEDKNAVEKASGSFKRYVLVLPMTEHFEPPRGTPGFGKLEFSDHCSMPASFANEITRRALEVPWHFELKPLDDVGPERDNEIVQGLGFPGREARGRPVQRETKRSRPREGDADGSAIGLLPAVKRVFCAPIDFRAPENFVFVPVWMLRQLRLEPYDVATLTSCTLKDGVTIELQPHQDAFLKLANPRAVLESELKYYTSATKGTTISLVYDERRYDFDIISCVGKDGRKLNEYNPEPCDAVTLQDSDVGLDLTSTGLDVALKRKRPEDENATAVLEVDDENVNVPVYS